jgi:hypothetical protein
MGRYLDTKPSTEASPWLNGNAVSLFQHYHSRYMGMAATRFQWVGLPPNINPMLLERTLLTETGLAAFVHLRPKEGLGVGSEEAPNGRFTVVRAAAVGPLDDLFYTAGYTTYSPRTGAPTSNRFNTNGPLKEWKGVPIWGDALRQNYDAETINLWANIMARAMLVVNVNMAATTRGVVVVTNQNKLVSSQVAVENALSGLPTFTADPDILDSIKALDFGVHPETVERSHVVAMRLYNEGLTALGLRPGAQEKQERLTDDEVQAITGSAKAIRQRSFQPRELAATQINTRYFEGIPIVKVIDQW